MTGLLVAGGSGAIFNIFTRLGLRNPTQLGEKAKAGRKKAAEAKAAAAEAQPAPPGG